MSLARTISAKYTSLSNTRSHLTAGKKVTKVIPGVIHKLGITLEGKGQVFHKCKTWGKLVRSGMAPGRSNTQTPLTPYLDAPEGGAEGLYHFGNLGFSAATFWTRRGPGPGVAACVHTS